MQMMDCETKTNDYLLIDVIRPLKRKIQKTLGVNMTTQSTIHNGADRWAAYDMLNDFVGPQIGKRYSIHTSTSLYILGELEFDGNLQ